MYTNHQMTDLAREEHRAMLRRAEAGARLLADLHASQASRRNTDRQSRRQRRRETAAMIDLPTRGDAA